jgi:hypothetical protein
MFPVKDKGRLKQKPRHSRPKFSLTWSSCTSRCAPAVSELCRLIVVFRLRGWSESLALDKASLLRIALSKLLSLSGREVPPRGYWAKLQAGKLTSDGLGTLQSRLFVPRLVCPSGT